MAKIAILKEAEGVVFDVLKTLSVIEQDQDLNDIFRKKVKLEYNILRTIEKDGLTNPDTKALLNELFDIILTKESLLELYKASVSEAPAVKKPTKEKTLPRRYGKDKIMMDIEKQDGKPTELQIAALAVNDLKNIYVNLNTRLISDMLGGTNLLSIQDCRDIIAVVDIDKKRLKNILKRKK